MEKLRFGSGAWPLYIKCLKAKGKTKISGRNSMSSCFARDSCGTLCTLNVSSGLDPWNTYF